MYDGGVSRRRTWQVEAKFPNGATMLFGTTGRSLPGALLKAYKTVAIVPQVASRLRIERLYSRHQQDRQAHHGGS